MVVTITAAATITGIVAEVITTELRITAVITRIVVVLIVRAIAVTITTAAI